jgi:hypothetical protein
VNPDAGQTETTAWFTQNGPTCQPVVSSSDATAGSVTVTSLQPKVVGTYDVTFMGDRFTGSFDAEPCSVPQHNEHEVDGGSTCVP